MDTILNEVITVLIGLTILAGAWFVNFLTGVSKYIFNEEQWSWKKFFYSLVKTLLMAIAIVAIVPVCEGLNWFALQCNCDISTLLDGVSVAGVLSGIIAGTIYYLKSAFDNIIAFINSKGYEVKVGDVNYKEIADKVIQIFSPADFEPSVEVITKQQEVDNLQAKEGGLGQYYSVPHDNYDNFRNTVMGNGYDLDGYYSYQCWDGACLLWQQLGRWLSTGGTGAAKGCWTHAKDENAGNDFELIYNLADAKRGDVMVFGGGKYGHIGYADEDYTGKGYIALLGQNQSSDMKFCVINMQTSTFLGAFRLKAWHTTPTPTPTPEPTPVETGFKVGDIVKPTKLVDYNGTFLRQYDDTYTIAELNGDRAVLTALRGDKQVVWCAISTNNIEKA